MSNYHILLVDDESYFLDVAETSLEKAGYIITSANSSKGALSLIEEYHEVFDLVITDYAMPEMNGVEFASLARKILLDTPIILHTGYTDFIDGRQVTEAGIAEVVRRPCKIRELDMTIKRILGMKEEVSL